MERAETCTFEIVFVQIGTATIFTIICIYAILMVILKSLNEVYEMMKNIFFAVSSFASYCNCFRRSIPNIHPLLARKFCGINGRHL